MKSYTITVNGNVYDVTVEEKGGVTPAAAPAPQAAPVMAQAPQAAPAPAAKSTGAGSVQVLSLIHIYHLKVLAHLLCEIYYFAFTAIPLTSTSSSIGMTRHFLPSIT